MERESKSIIHHVFPGTGWKRNHQPAHKTSWVRRLDSTQTQPSLNENGLEPSALLASWLLHLPPVGGRVQEPTYQQDVRRQVGKKQNGTAHCWQVESCTWPLAGAKCKSQLASKMSSQCHP
eukprot:gene20244-1055_t